MSRRLRFEFLTLATLLGLAAWSLAQDGIPNSSQTDVGIPFLRKKSDFEKVIAGQERNEALIDLAARYYAYRLQWPTERENLDNKLGKYVAEFERDLITPLLSSNNINNNKANRDLLGKALAQHFDKVFKLDFLQFRPSVTHAALSLPALAKLKQDDVADLLNTLVVDDKQHDAVKLYAMRSMKEFFPAGQITEDDDPTDKKIIGRKKLDMGRIDALTRYIEAKRPTPAKQGELDAIRYIRREAIHALAQAKVPAVAALKKEAKVDGPVAPTLMRVLIPKALEPEPSLSEKIEAAWGLCHLKCEKLPAYDPQMGVYLVARFLEEYVKNYAAEFLNLNKRPQLIAWKIQSERLRLALEELEKNTKDSPNAYKHARELKRVGKDYMELLKTQKENVANFARLTKVARDARPTKSNALFKGVKGFEIDPGPDE